MALMKNEIKNITTHYEVGMTYWKTFRMQKKLQSDMKTNLFLFIEKFHKLKVSWCYMKIKNSRQKYQVKKKKFS